MEWSNGFKALLKDYDQAYAPMFRLTIGTEVVAPRHQGRWETRSGPKTLELLTHPDTNSVTGTTGSNDVYGHGTHLMGEPYLYGVGLTGKISFGAQSVKPRTWVYTGQSLSVGVTRWAASQALKMAVGTLSRLQVKMVTGKIDVADEPWEDIHYGMYDGMKWTGSEYTLNFKCALEAASCRSTEDEIRSTDTSLYKWFAGCGTKYAIEGTFTTYGGYANQKVGATHEAAYDTRLGRTYKKRDSYGGESYHYGGSALYASPGVPGQTNQWVGIKNTSGNNTFLRYNGLIVMGAFGGSPGAGIDYCSSLVYELPGFAGLGGGGVSGGIGDESELTVTCVLHGTPVTEFVNTVYIQGYADEMVPGIFGEDYGSLAPQEPVNRSDIARAHTRFNDQFRLETGHDPTERFVPFRAVITKEVLNGYGEMKKLCGKWGVFPRFKEGGYGMQVMQPAWDPDHGISAEAVSVIILDDIQGAETQTEQATIGGFQTLRYEAACEDALGAGGPGGGAFVLEDSDLGPAHHIGLPNFGTLTVTTDDVAKGVGDHATVPSDGWAKRFAAYFKAYLYADFWQVNRIEATVRLRGFKHAHVAPGDWVHICIPTDPHGWTPHGPAVIINPNDAQHVLDSSNIYDHDSFDASDITTDDLLAMSESRPWLCTSSHVDWVGCKVTLTMSRPTYAMAQTSWRDDEGATSILTPELGIVDPLIRDDI